MDQGQGAEMINIRFLKPFARTFGISSITIVLMPCRYLFLGTRFGLADLKFNNIGTSRAVAQLTDGTLAISACHAAPNDN